MKKRLEELKWRLQEVQALNAVSSVLGWDQTTYMPPGGAAARGRQMAVVARLAHEKLTDPEIGHLLDRLERDAADLPDDGDEAALIRVTRRDYERAARIPADFVSAFNEHQTTTYQAWTTARPADDFKALEPMLEKTLDFSPQLSGFFPGFEHVADPLIDLTDEGMTVALLGELFRELREALVPLVQSISEATEVDDSCLKQHFPAEAQLEFGKTVIREFGYDFDRGREDLSPHPFTTAFSIGDVRITTRIKENDITEALFGTLHEAGHGMYEQGIDPAYEGLPLADGASSGVHESQSRLWENIVGRSLAFWEHYYPRLQSIFSEQLGRVSLATFYKAINKVTPSLIRTDADEVTYNLHVMIRFELEKQLLNGTLPVSDLPEAWDARYESDMGVSAPDDRDGVLQDVHWYAGRIGGVFQGYTLGNVLSAQFYKAALQDLPEIGAQTSEGSFELLGSWMKENIYRHGRKYTPSELIERATGGPIQVQSYIDYLKKKFGDLYGLK
ncbi:MAG: carboxypeptidase M32 [Anaerolineales bacterium]|nr:carboxypeptidase M32 [Anaerolineales bacterium]